MNQTREGALTKNDIALMSTGYWTYLPPDKEGRTVLFNDFSWIVKDNVASRMRNLFYGNHVVLQNEMSTEKGIVMIVFLSHATVETLKGYISGTVDAPRIWREAFPFHIDSLHVIPRVKKESFLADSVPFVLKFFQDHMSVGKKRFVHRGINTGDMARFLERKHGILQSGLPEVLGGEFSFEKFVMWQERQIRIEWDLPLGQLDEFEYGSYSARPLSQLNEEERVERKRRYNILHSRRKRRRDRVETEVVKKQVESLVMEKEDLEAEGERLENLIAQAKRVVEISTTRNSFAAPVATQMQPGALGNLVGSFAASIPSGTLNSAAGLGLGGDGGLSSLASYHAYHQLLKQRAAAQMATAGNPIYVDLSLLEQQQQQQPIVVVQQPQQGVHGLFLGAGGLAPGQAFNAQQAALLQAQQQMQQQTMFLSSPQYVTLPANSTPIASMAQLGTNQAHFTGAAVLANQQPLQGEVAEDQKQSYVPMQSRSSQEQQRYGNNYQDRND